MTMDVSHRGLTDAQVATLADELAEAARTVVGSPPQADGIPR